MLSGRISESVPVRQLADTELGCENPQMTHRQPRPAICTVLGAVFILLILVSLQK